MGISLIQSSFASGELAPSLAGRVDLARYQTGLKLCRNFAIMPYGGARNRPGLQYIDRVKGDKVCRLIRFKFNASDAYAIEMTDKLMRFYRDGALVLNSAGPNIGQPFELVTPFLEAELFEVNFTQSADVMTFVHPAHKPHQLRRFAHDNWTIAPISLVPSVAAPATATATTTAGTGNTQVWRYQVTAVVDDGNTIDESLPVTSNTVTVSSSVLKAELTWDAVAGATYYNVYKDNSGSGVYGFAGRSTTPAFTDNNISATRTDTPPTGMDPFTSAGNYPGAVGYFQQRLVFGGTDFKPQTSWFSKTGVFNNFGYSTPNKDDDAIIFTQASLEINRVMHYLPLRQLLVLTSGSEWVMEGGNTGLTAKSITANAQSYNGIGLVPPLVIDNTAIYVQARGSLVSSLSYQLSDDGFAGSDLTVLSNHLFRDFSIVDWCYAKVPDTTIWSVRSDGKMLGLTYLREQEVAAWHQHDTDGFFESCCSVPEGREDAIYAVVRRQINGQQVRYVERFASRQIPKTVDGEFNTAQCFFVDSGLSYQGWNKTGAMRTLSDGDEWKYPEVLTLTGAGFTAGDVGDNVVFSYLDEGGKLRTLRVRVSGYISPTQVDVEPLGVVPEQLRDTPTANWARAVDVLSGLSHLEGKAVSVLADGNVELGHVVADGKIELQTPSAVVHVGLPYVCDLETLAINITGQETLFDKTKTIPSVTVLLEESRGLSIGPRFDQLEQMKQRDDGDGYESIRLLTGTEKINIPTNWEGAGRLCIRQTDPLPLSILAVIPDLVTGGKA